MKAKGRKAKFKAGQVVAECFLFKGTKGVFVKGYFSLSRTLADMYNEDNFSRGLTSVRYIRRLTKRERGG